MEEAQVCVVITDLTDQKRSEEMLRRSHGELEIKVRERTAAASEGKFGQRVRQEEGRRSFLH